MSGHSIEPSPGATFTGYIKFYSCTQLPTGSIYGCPFEYNFTIYDKKADGAGPIIFVNPDIDHNSSTTGAIYMHDTYGKGSSSYEDQPKINPSPRTTYGVEVSMCNGGSKAYPSNCKSYYYDDPYDS